MNKHKINVVFDNVQQNDFMELMNKISLLNPSLITTETKNGESRKIADYSQLKQTRLSLNLLLRHVEVGTGLNCGTISRAERGKHTQPEIISKLNFFYEKLKDPSFVYDSTLEPSYTNPYRERRRMLKMTRYDVAQLSYLSYATIAKVERGHKVGAWTIKKLDAFYIEHEKKPNK